ncbi:MAG: hypothetical protein GY847_36420 [Proteobacteria bacterium]|nr:hypothetical protein [Pseudomonadota bacterium]
MKSRLLFGILFLMAACDQRVDEGEDLLTGGNQSIAVSFGEAVEVVLFDNLNTQTILNNTPVVSVKDIVIGSGLLASESAVDEIWINFLGTDEYSPVANDNCESEFNPTSGQSADKVFVERGTCNMLWNESIDIEPCMVVKEVATIELTQTEDGFDGEGDSDTDTDTDTEPPPDCVNIHYGEDMQKVLLSEVETTTLDDIDVRLVSSIIEAAGFDIDFSNTKLSFEGDDGYNPTAEGTCTDSLPAPGENASKAGLENLTGDLYWESKLAFPGCAFVKRVATIYLKHI